MLPSVSRLRRSADFQRVVRQGRRASSRTVVVHALPAVDALSGSPAVIGFVVSKAVGNAVTRNQVKRRLREASRARLDSLAGCRLVVRATPAAATADFTQLSRDLDRCLATMSRTARAGAAR